MYPVECVARGYLTGSVLGDYQTYGEVCGIALPAGLQDGSRLSEPIFTPATKAALGDHDENVDFESVAEKVGDDAAAELRMLTLAIYGKAEEIARERGIILADTKFEFGRRADYTTVLADEVLTPDSSRFWPADGLAAGPHAGVVRQAVRAQLAALARVGLGPRVGRGAAAVAGGDRGAHADPVPRGVRAPHRPVLVTSGT